MGSIKNYGYMFTCSYYESVRKIVFGLMLLYFMLAMVCPDLTAHAIDMNTSVGTGGGGDLPWETPMMLLQRSLTGPFAKAIAMIVVVVAGIFVALGEGGPAGRLVGRLVFGLGLLFGALTIIEQFM